MELRPYRQTDYDGVLKLDELALREAGANKDGGPRDDDLRDIEAAFAGSGGECWVGEEDGDIVAMGAFRPTSNDTAEIKRLRVAPALQRRGYGRRMLDKLEERAKARGCVLLHLDTTAEQTAARRLCESAGYSVHDRRVVDGGDRYMYAKWLGDPEAVKEMTPEEEAKFYADWDVSQQLTEYAKSLLREGATPEQAMEKVLGSELYADWTGTERCFRVEYEGIELYDDLLANVESEAYIANIERKAERFFESFAAEAKEEALDDADEADERIFAQNGIRVTPSRLAWEMARFSWAIGLAKPIRYLHFIALFSGASIVDMEQDQVDVLVANKEKAIELAEAFAGTYGESPRRSGDAPEER
ncbi:GNAT family N-acetyltransferase [Paenibacillus sp. GYB003]|uniref:GNAT family N-acetyltransferase n=1 Tax=Paenibacillus sp. GYB003 TaxID=2994392 RepID=UPI002F96CD62